MAVVLGNKYQSKNRDNFRKITGLSEANEKIKPENMPRIYGGIGEVYFNGQSAAGSSTGNGGGNTGQIDPNSGGGSGGGGSGGGGSGGSGSGSGNCVCENISEAGGVVGIPCCVSGFNCEDGTPVSVQLNPNGGVPILPCEDPMPKPTPEDPVLKLAVGNCQNRADPMIFTQKSGASAAASALSATTLEKYIKENCPNAPSDKKYTRETYIDFTHPRIYYTESCVSSFMICSGCIHITLCEAITDESQITDEMREFYSKNKGKKYFVKDGKFYDACDPYGTPPSDEPITMCDGEGNKYSVSPDGKIKAL